MTNATSGPNSTASSRSAVLQSALESRLRARLEGLGSPLYGLTWKDWEMPLGPPICRLRAWVRRISVSVCSGSVNLDIETILTGWPTTDAGVFNTGDMKFRERRERVKKNYGPGHNGFGLTLGMAVQLVGYPTPLAPTGGRSIKHAEVKGGTYYSNGKKVQASLEGLVPVILDGWPTATTGGKSWSDEAVTAWLENGRQKHGLDLGGAVQLVGWATVNAPRLHDSDKSAFRWNPNKTQDDPVMQLIGRTSSLSSVPTEKRGQLNPDFSGWLMGYPIYWGRYAPKKRPKKKG